MDSSPTVGRFLEPRKKKHLKRRRNSPFHPSDAMISTMEPKVTLIVEEVDASSEKSTVDQLRLRLLSKII